MIEVSLTTILFCKIDMIYLCFCEKCYENDDCEFWVYRGSNETCWLRKNWDSTENKSDYTSGWGAGWAGKGT